MAEQLAAHIYSALLGETPWLHFLQQLADTLPDGKAALVVHDATNGEGHALIAGAKEYHIRNYNAHYGKHNMLQTMLADKPIGTGFLDEELMPRSCFLQTEFYNELLLPSGMAYSAGVKFASEATQSFALVVASKAKYADAVHQSISSLELLAPHLKRAFEATRAQSQRYQSGLSDSACLLDNLAVASIVVTPGGRTRTLSDAARQIIDQRPSCSLRITYDGRVHFRCKEHQAVLDHILKRGYNGTGTVDLYSHQTKVTLVRCESNAETLYFSGPTVIILIQHIQHMRKRRDLRLLAEAFGLSPTEQRALAGIFAGKSIAAIAAEAHRSKETIRSQLKSLYQKTGTTSSKEILRLF